jgi:hypothetical protein
MEYLLMMGFTLLLLIPIMILFATESNNIKSDIAASHATQIARKIADKAEEMYYQGEPSKTTIRVNIPQGIENITFQNREVVIYYKTPDGVLQEIIQVTPINISGSISSLQGIHLISIKSEGDYVSISEG